MKTLLAATLLAITSVFGYSQAPDPPSSKTTGVGDVYLARDKDGKAGDETKEFTPNDIPIHCVVTLESTASVTVKMNFVAVNVPGVRPDTKVVTTSYTTKQGQNQVNFTGRPYDKWTPGRYRVDIFIDGKPARDVEFTIRGPIVAPGPVTKFNQTTASPHSRSAKKPGNNLAARRP
ncbi:MAG: hypothetical protein JO053_07595 [Acidobacteria bacterium]|nr:hypothetical protein [Acidobacteriota bacterium]